MGNDHRARWHRCSSSACTERSLENVLPRRQQERDPKANRRKIITHRTTKRSGRVFPLGRFLCPAAELRKNLAANMSALNGEFSGTPNFPKARSCILWRTRSLPDYGTITAIMFRYVIGVRNTLWMSRASKLGCEQLFLLFATTDHPPILRNRRGTKFSQ